MQAILFRFCFCYVKNVIYQVYLCLPLVYANVNHNFYLIFQVYVLEIRNNVIIEKILV